MLAAAGQAGVCVCMHVAHTSHVVRGMWRTRAPRPHAPIGAPRLCRRPSLLALLRGLPLRPLPPLPGLAGRSLPPPLPGLAGRAFASSFLGAGGLSSFLGAGGFLPSLLPGFAAPPSAAGLAPSLLPGLAPCLLSGLFSAAAPSCPLVVAAVGGGLAAGGGAAPPSLAAGGSGAVPAAPASAAASGTASGAACGSAAGGAAAASSPACMWARMLACVQVLRASEARPHATSPPTAPCERCSSTQGQRALPTGNRAPGPRPASPPGGQARLLRRPPSVSYGQWAVIAQVWRRWAA